MQQHTILVIDDDTLFCDALSMAQVDDNLRFLSAHTAAEGLTQCRKQSIPVVLLDQQLPDRPGADICPEILKANDQTKIIFSTAYPEVETAVQAVKMGAFDYLTKPFDLDTLLLTIRRALRTSELEQVEEVTSWKQRKKSKQAVFIGSSPETVQVRQAAALAADSRAPVLITGDTGTGKSYLAGCIHHQSLLSSRPYIKVNCGSLPEQLIETELFGHEKGAFTGAVAKRRGLFEMADGGTLFLDEIGTLPVHLQVKLLGVLDDGIVQRIGGESAHHVDVRIIAATNMELDKAVATGAFREDLLYRLSVLNIHIPPLAERSEDIGELSELFLAMAGQEEGLSLAAAEIDALRLYGWPGNVRELKNIIDRAIILHQDGSLRPSKLLSSGSGSLNGKHNHSPEKNGSTFQLNGGVLHSLADAEKKYIHYVLAKTEHNQSETARILNISRSTLIRKMKQYAAVKH
jgi:DNA-binding NtrC family response regulator